MRKGSFVLLAMFGALDCSGSSVQDGAAAGAGHGGTGVTAAAGNGGIAAGGGSGAPPGLTGGAGGGSGSSSPPPRFLFIGPADPSGSPQASRQYSVLLNGASDDGSVLVGSSAFYDAATSTFEGVNFYWTEASGVVTLAAPSDPSRTVNVWPSVSPDGTSVFGYYSGGVFRWTKQNGYAFFPASWPVPVPPTGVVDISFSRDGTVAWGSYADSTQSYGFRWRPSDGLVTSGSLPGWPADGLYAEYLQPSTCGGCGILVGGSPSSDDGKVVAGYHQPSLAPGAQLLHGFIWSEPGTLLELGPLPGTSACSVGALSRDGTTAFGSCAQDPEGTRTVFRWTAASGMVVIGPTGDDAYYTDTTRDGRVAMGRNGTNALSRWTADSGAVKLQPSANTIDPAQYGLSMTPGSLSDDGGSVFGRASRIDFQPGFEEESPADGFRWSATDGFVLLPPLPGYDIATVAAAAPDGSVQIGISRLRLGNPASLPERVVLWDCRGVRDIAAELAAGGIDLQGGGLSDVLRVWSSGASIMIVGYGTANGVAGAWIAWLPRRC